MLVSWSKGLIDLRANNPDFRFRGRKTALQLTFVPLSS